jgi:hypothetical protein
MLRRKMLWLEGLERNDCSRILNAGNGLNPLVHKVSDIGVAIDIELYQEIIVARRRVDFRGYFCVSKLICDIIGLAELTFDLDKEGDHFRLQRVALRDCGNFGRPRN